MTLCTCVPCDINQWPYRHATLFLKFKRNVAKFWKRIERFVTRAYYKAILQKLHRQKLHLHRWIWNKHQREFLNVSNDVLNWFSEGQNYKNHKGIVIQRLWVFEFSDPVLDFRDASELRVPPNLVWNCSSVLTSDLILHTSNMLVKISLKIVERFSNERNFLFNFPYFLSKVQYMTNHSVNLVM